MVGVGTGEEGMEDMGTAEEGMRAGMEEAMAEGGTIMEEVTVEEGVEEGTAEEGTKEGMAAEGREATAEVDTGVEPFIMVAPKATWFTLHNVEGFQEGLQNSRKCEGRPMVWETCEVREENTPTYTPHTAQHDANLSI
jgi:hypothetical protein